MRGPPASSLSTTISVGMPAPTGVFAGSSTCGGHFAQAAPMTFTESLTGIGRARRRPILCPTLRVRALPIFHPASRPFFLDGAHIVVLAAALGALVLRGERCALADLYIMEFADGAANVRLEALRYLSGVGAFLGPSQTSAAL